MAIQVHDATRLLICVMPLHVKTVVFVEQHRTEPSIAHVKRATEASFANKRSTIVSRFRVSIVQLV
jgi:hypothetical protein